MAIFDITVMGAGIFGLSVAYACAQRGARVQVIDPGGVAAGASGGIVGALAPHVPENWNAKKQFQFESLIMAESHWAEVSARSGLDSGYARTGRLQPLADAAAIELAQARAKGAADLWQGKADWTVKDAAPSGWTPPTPTGAVIFDSLSAHLHPQQACRALAGAIQSLGGVVGRRGDLSGQVVWATGWQGVVEVGGGGVKGQAALLEYDAAGEPQLFAQSLHIVPHLDGTVAIGSTSERDFVASETTDAQLDDLLGKAVAAFPVLAGARVIARWAGVRPRSRSRAPILGAHPQRKGQFIANGGFKIGFGMAPKVGCVMADFLLDGRDTIPEDFKQSSGS